ncbi:MAG: ATP-binding cassette domain-containing protein, partial [Rudaea sp.]
MNLALMVLANSLRHLQVAIVRHNLISYREATRCNEQEPYRMSAIQTRGLTRTFSSGKGVHNLDLEVPNGSIYGFLGPNGAGKSTTIRLLLGLMRPDGGEVRLFDRRLTRSDRKALSLVGAMVESPSLYPHLSAYDNLDVTRQLLGAPRRRIDEVL